MMRLLHSILQACRLQSTFAANLKRLRHLLPLHLLLSLQKTHQRHPKSVVARARLLCPSKAEMWRWGWPLAISPNAPHSGRACCD